MQAQTKPGLRSLRPGIQLPTVDPTWMQPRRSAAHRPRIKRKRLVDVEWREDRQKEVRDALLELLRLGDHAHGCCIPPHQGGWCALSGSQASPDFAIAAEKPSRFFAPVSVYRDRAYPSPSLHMRNPRAGRLGRPFVCHDGANVPPTFKGLEFLFQKLVRAPRRLLAMRLVVWQGGRRCSSRLHSVQALDDAR